MRATTRCLAALAPCAVAPCAIAPWALAAQAPDTPPLLRARHLAPTAQVKVFVTAGTLRIVGWDRDSIAVRGRVARGERFYLGGADDAIKLGVEEPRGATAGRSDLVIQLPMRSRLAVRTVSADVEARDVAGWFYTVSGDVRASGAASSLDVLSMSGAVDLDVRTPWVRARTGDGRLRLAGAPEDADVSTIGGALEVAIGSVRRGQLATVSGAIRMVGAPAAGAIVDVSSHGGDVELVVPMGASARLTLSSVVGTIESSLAPVRPAASPPPHALTLRLGGGAAHVTVRTYRGSIRVRAP